MRRNEEVKGVWARAEGDKIAAPTSAENGTGRGDSTWSALVGLARGVIGVILGTMFRNSGGVGRAPRGTMSRNSGGVGR